MKRFRNIIIQIRHLKIDEGAGFAILFFALLAPFALSYLFHHPDETHYTNAAISMIQSGDILTPTYPDGSPRFLKPIFTYWSILASYLVFGVSEFSSRLPGLLAAALFLWFFCRQVGLISNSRNTAKSATAILAANPLFIMSSARAIPDIWLTIFLSVAGLGFLRIYTAKGKNSGSLAMIYLGTAFAVATKGLPALAYSGIAVLFLLFNPYNRIPLKKLISVYWLPVAAFIAFGWYVAVFKKHGAVVFDSFFDDQVSKRVGITVFSILKGFAFGVLFFIAYTFPWNIGILTSARKTFEKPGLTAKFILLWVLATLVLCMIVTPFYDRYLLPAIPFAAIFMGEKSILLIRGKPAILTVYISRFLVMLILVAAIFSGWLFQPTALFWVLTLTLATVNFLFWVKCKNIAWLDAVSILSLFAGFYLILSPAILPNQGKQIARRLAAKNIHSAVMINDPKVAAKVRVNAGASFKPGEQKTVESSSQPAIVSNKLLEKIAQKPVIADTLSYSPADFDLGELIKARLNHSMDEYRRTHSEMYFLVERWED